MPHLLILLRTSANLGRNSSKCESEPNLDGKIPACWVSSQWQSTAWLFNWEFRKPEGSVYSGELSLPRLLSVVDGRLRMQPELGYRRLRQKRLDRPSESRIIPSLTNAVELTLRGDLGGVQVVGTAANGAAFKLAEVAGRLIIEMPEDDGKIVYRSGVFSLTQVTVFFDRGVLEIFANDGAMCGTRRSYRMADLANIEITKGTETANLDIEAWSLRSAWE